MQRSTLDGVLRGVGEVFCYLVHDCDAVDAWSGPWSCSVTLVARKAAAYGE